MSNAKQRVLLIGATGYIGGTLLLQLLERDTFEISALVRSPEKAQKLRDLKISVKVIEGSPADLVVLEKATDNIDIVIDVALVNDDAGTTNLLNALKKHYDATGKLVHLVHFTGAGMLADDACGRDIPSIIYDDADVDQMAGAPETAIHIDIDLKFVKADEDGYILSYLVLPGVTYGQPSNILVDAGIQKENNIQFHAIVPLVAAFKGEPVSIGGGYNHWAIVEYAEVADLTVVLVDQLASMTVPHGKEGYFFAESGEILLRRESELIARTIDPTGTLPPRTLTPDEVHKHIPAFWAGFFGANCRCHATRAKRLGWVPKRTIKDFELEVVRYTKEYMSTIA